MKRSLFAFLALISAAVCPAHFEGGELVIPDPEGPLENYRLPLTERATSAFRDIILQLDCEFDEFFLMSGIDIPKGGTCALNLEEGLIELKLDRPHAQLAIMLVGDLMLFCADDKITKKHILERYAFTGHSSKCWMLVSQNPDDRKWHGEQDGADQPATAPKSEPKGKEKPEPESKARAQ